MRIPNPELGSDEDCGYGGIPGTLVVHCALDPDPNLACTAAKSSAVHSRASPNPMRNLAVSGSSRRQLELRHGESAQALTVDSENARFFLASDCCTLYWMALSGSQPQSCLELAGQEQEQAVVGMEYMVEAESVLVGMESGDIVLAHPASGDVQVIGSLEGGMRAMAASPDGTLVALATGTGQLTVMTTDWDPVYERSISQPPCSSCQTVPPGGLDICWRADAKYFATVERDFGNEQSLIKVWERDDGTLHSRCSPLPSSQAAMCWCPGGARIAAGYTQAKSQGPPLVVLFERNGLKKDSFQVAAPAGARLEALQWDSSGQVLHILLRCDAWDAIQLWSCSNYHWYLKQERRYAPEDSVRLAWHPEAALCAIAWTTRGGLEVLDMVWKAAVHSSSTALSVDGQNVLVTPLALSIIPPPLFFLKLRFDQAVNAVALAADGPESAIVAASLSDGSIHLASLSGIGELEGTELQGSVLHGFTGPELRAITFVSARGLCGVSRADEKLLVELEVSSSGLAWEAGEVRQVRLDSQVVAVCARDSDVFLQLDDGSLVRRSFGQAGSSTSRVGSFLRPCPWLDVVVCDNLLFIGLDRDGNLHVRDKIVNDRCTGFTVHTTSRHSFHLVYTTKRDQLHVHGLDGNGSPSGRLEVLDVCGATGAGGKSAAADKNFNVRRVWERGARIVGSLSGIDGAVILQAGRGNLETVYPRGLVLEEIAGALAQDDFEAAVHCARRHRIDLNVVVDFMGPKLFAVRASEFVKQVGALSIVNELVCALRKDNVLESTYGKTISSWYVPSEEAGGDEASGSNKVRVVLQALRESVEALDAGEGRQLCLLTILARSDPPLLEDALGQIKKLREQELLQQPQHKSNEKLLTAEAAVKHLIWLANVEAVFNSALGIYDLHLAAMVASNSQRDPKEFLPFLEELEAMPAHMMRYKIDLKLHKYESALRNLCSHGDHFDDALELLKQHAELFPVGLSIFTQESSRSTILDAWGQHLLAEQKLEDAAIAFCACSQLDKALSAYRAAGKWQSSLALAGKLNMPVSQLASELRDELQALGKPREAARVALDYCNDPEGGVRHLIEARDWVEVLRVCHLYGRADLVSSLVRPSAEDCAEGHVSRFQEGMEKIGKYVARFTAVRQRRLLLEAKLKEDASSRSLDDDETASDISTTSSSSSSNLSGLSSVYTRGTSRSVKSKASRRPGRVRPGSPGEELALVEHLKSMAMSSQMAEEELRPLLQLLVLLGQSSLASKLQRTALVFQQAQAEAVRQVDPPGTSPSLSWSYDAL